MDSVHFSLLPAFPAVHAIGCWLNWNLHLQLLRSEDIQRRCYSLSAVTAQWTCLVNMFSECVMSAWSGATVSFQQSNCIHCVADSNHFRLRSSSYSQIVFRHTQLSTVVNRAFPLAGTVCCPTSPQLQCWLLFGTASKLIYFPDHFLPNCFRFLILYTVYSSGLAVLYLSHSK